MFWTFGRKSKVVSPVKPFDPLKPTDSVANNSIIQEAMKSMGPTKLPSPYTPYTPNLNLPASITPKKKEDTKEKTKYSESYNSSDNTAVYTAIGAAIISSSYDSGSSSSCDSGSSSGSSGCD